MKTYRIRKPAVLQEIDLHRHTVIEASAGTGKTYTLEHLILDLMLTRELSLDEILVVTFTEKATREMRERVRRKIQRALQPETSDLAAEDEPAFVIDEAARNRLEDALVSFERAPISTIHAFCQRVITEHAFECSRLLDQESVDARVAFRMAFMEELRIVLGESSEDAEILRFALRRWSTATLEDALRSWFEERGTPTPLPDPARARHEMAGLADALRFDSEVMDLTRLQDMLSAEGLRRNVVAKVVQALQALTEVLNLGAAGGSDVGLLVAFWEWMSTPVTKKQSNVAYVRDNLQKCSQGDTGIGRLAVALDRVLDAAGDSLGLLIARFLPRVCGRLEERKREDGLFDFDDLLKLVRDTLAGDSGARLLSSLRGRYRVALVDEFQDTDERQWEIFRRIFFESKEQRLFVIGDPKQAIYGFRNADLHTYLGARETILEADGRLVVLSDNYRSRSAVIDVVNEILAESFFTGSNRYDHPVRCALTERGALDSRGQPFPALTIAHWRGSARFGVGQAQRAYANWIAERIANLLTAPLCIQRSEGVDTLRASDIQILCQTSSEATAVAKALAQANIPHAVYKQKGLFKTPAAEDVLTLLRAVVHPDDPSARHAVWLTPFFAVALEDLPTLRGVANDHPLVSDLYALKHLADTQQWERFFRAAFEDTGLVQRELFFSSTERHLTDYQHLAELLLEETKHGYQSAERLTARLKRWMTEGDGSMEASKDIQRIESRADCVQILTLHKSKGLEAEVVFLFPKLLAMNKRSLEPAVYHDASGRRCALIQTSPRAGQFKAVLANEREQEHQRLLYVALTRACSALYVPYLGPYAAEGQLSLLNEESSVSAMKKSLTGTHLVLNRRLEMLFADGWVKRAAGRVRVLPCMVTDRQAAQWITGDSDTAFILPELSRFDAVVQPEYFERLRARGRGFEITSYTRMKRASRKVRSTEVESERFERAFKMDEGMLEPVLNRQVLPGGSGVGVFLHEVLEHAELRWFSEAGSLENLAQHATFEQLLRSRAKANGVEERWLGAAAQLIWNVVHTPLTLEPSEAGRTTIVELRRILREMSFLHPIPEPMVASDEAPPPVRRGYIRGVVDLVFEHAGRLYIADYKSDRLPAYETPQLSEHVQKHYAVQARLYVLGLIRAFQLDSEAEYESRFGSILYLFLRGMNPETPCNSGVYQVRPSWSEVMEWEATLRSSDTPWGYHLPSSRSLESESVGSVV